MLIIPTILTDQITLVQEQLDRIQKESNLTRVQIDVIDPEFTDNITISPIDLPQLDLHAFRIDIHLMTNDPINDLVECSQVPGVGTVISQVEHMSSQKAFIDQARGYNLKVGLSLDLTTPIEAIEPESWGAISTIQVMGIQAGAQGRPFAPETLKKIRTIHGSHPSLELLVDGGVKPDNLGSIQAAGATGVTVGSFLWESDNLSNAIAKLMGGA